MENEKKMYVTTEEAAEMYERQNDLKGQKQKLEKSLER